MSALWTPTEEQRASLVLFKGGDSMVIEAGAGTGKTSTLMMLAEAVAKKGRYLAFNKSIVTDVTGRLPSTCVASTAHSLAFRQIATPYAHRLRAPRMRGEEIARIVDVDQYVITFGKQRKTLAAGFLAGVVMRAVTRFCQTADEQPSRRHVPYLDGIDIPDDQGNRTFAVNNALAAFLEPSVERAWADIRRTDGQLPFKHEHYLKLWQLSHPRIEAEYILFDEAQDANPVMAAVVEEQTHAQRVYVGDANQAIYEWTGAINSIETMRLLGLPVRQLSESFRFGDAIAQAANEVLAKLESDLILTGQPSILSTVGAIGEGSEAHAVLCRTNAGAMTTLLTTVRKGKSAYLVGGGAEVLSFARAAARLQAGEKVWHQDLACFDTWGEVLDYVQQDAQGGELRALVKLIEEFTIETIIEALDRQPRADKADVTVSTAHKAKGREWESVRIAEDFADVEPSKAEYRLRYVAITRAREHLDHSIFTRSKKEETDGDTNAA